MVSLSTIRRSLAAHDPRIDSADRHAAVAMIFAPRGSELEVLFIERSERAGDPWSGQMAFPGGRVDPSDQDARCAAERETREEVGLSLESAEILGRLDDQSPRHQGGLVISAWVYHLDEPRAPRINHEVREAFWVPLAHLQDPGRQVEQTFPGTGDLRFPGIRVGHPQRHVVWGLTYRFVEDFFGILGAPLGNPT